MHELKLECVGKKYLYPLAVDEDFIREIAIKRMRDGDKKVGKPGKGDVDIKGCVSPQSKSLCCNI